ncbi:uncharacterized protein LOC101844965 [Aplysia californica]|uniref:Uncharacterized protein LOC101844965 n=1 Tax=Aplysia californica TaxID=6500 RepID=A0ABM0JBR5_APLCA|nr:uncharacterized protein LOC101844965 [Aplysia californica]
MALLAALFALIAISSCAKAESEPRFVVSPNEINPGKTSELTVRCSIPPKSKLGLENADVCSIIVSYSLVNETHGFKDVLYAKAGGVVGAYLQDNLPKEIQSAVASGLTYPPSGDPYVELRIFNPAWATDAWFRCQTLGMDDIGHAVFGLTTSPVHVTSVKV